MHLQDYLALAAIFIGGIIFYLPFINWPTDPHFGVFSLWTLFTPPGKPIPEQLICGNQGFSRIYLHYVMHILNRLWGQKNLLHNSRRTQATLIALTGCIVYGMTQNGLGVSRPAALLAAFFYIFTATRPRLDPVYINAEPYYSLAACLAVWLLLSCAANQSPLWPLFAAYFLLAFMALNAKIVYIIDFILLGCGYLLTTKAVSITLAASFASLLLAIALFYLIFRQYLKTSRLKNLTAYAGWARSRAGKIKLSDIFTSTIAPTPLPRLALFGLSGALWLIIKDGNWLLFAWIISSLSIIAAQQRLCNYHFQTAIAPLSAAAAILFNIVFKTPPFFVSMGILLILLLERKNIQTAIRLFRVKSVKGSLEVAFGNDYYKYFDTRLGDIVIHHSSYKKSFIAWGVAPQLFAMTREQPYTFAGAVTRLAHSVFPGQQVKLIKAVTSTPHPWIYDLSDNLPAKGAFNPLIFYKSTGCLYKQMTRLKDIGYFQLIGKREIEPNFKLNLFLNKNPELDLLEAEEAERGHYGLRPPCWQKDILYLSNKWVQGEENLPDQNDIIEAENTADSPPHSISQVYSSLIFGLCGNNSAALKKIQLWDSNQNPFLLISPILQAVTWLVYRITTNNEQRWPLKTGILNRIQFHEAARLAPFIYYIYKSEYASTSEKRILQATLDKARLRDGPYDDWRSRNKLAAFLKSYCQPITTK